MAKAITGDHLLAAVTSQTFIKDGIAECAEGVKYDFRMGSRVLKAKYGRSMDMDKMPEPDKAEMAVEPGEVVFVLTEETLELPVNMMAHLMPKRKLSHEGILVLGGFCVDPLYSGKLLVGLYNFSSSRFMLEPRRKLIAAVFYELEAPEIGAFEKPEASVLDFPAELVRLISSYQPIDLKSLRDNILGLENQISSLKTDILTDKEWKRDFQTKLELQAKNIDKLLEGLDDEKQNRLAAEKSINEQLSGLKVGQGQAIVQSRTSHTLFVALLSTIITALLTVAITLFAVWLSRK